MAKDKIAYVCENCGYDSPKWIGKCPNCGQWNTFKEIRVAANQPVGLSSRRDAALTAGKRVWATGNDDFHSVRDFHNAWNMVLVKEELLI